MHQDFLEWFPGILALSSFLILGILFVAKMPAERRERLIGRLGQPSEKEILATSKQMLAEMDKNVAERKALKSKAAPDDGAEAR